MGAGEVLRALQSANDHMMGGRPESRCWMRADPSNRDRLGVCAVSQRR